MKIPSDIARGSILGYFTAQSIFNQVIVWKESDQILPMAHIEIFAGYINGKPMSWASRDGLGVNLYDFRVDGLQIIRSLNTVFDEAKLVDAWFETIRRTPYGWCDIETAAGVPTKSITDIAELKRDGVDCSHFAAMILEVGGCPQFDVKFPKNEITPRDFKTSANSGQIYP